MCLLGWKFSLLACGLLRILNEVITHLFKKEKSKRLKVAFLTKLVLRGSLHYEVRNFPSGG